MARVRAVVAKVAPHNSAERYRGLGADVISGRARLVDPWTVEVDGRRLTSRRIVVATGAEPVLPPIPGLADVAPLTSETLWSLTERPARLLVVGGGAIGCELAQAFARLGSATTLVEGAPRVISREDEDVSAAMRAALAADGVAVIEGVAVASFGRTEAGFVALSPTVARSPSTAWSSPSADGRARAVSAWKSWAFSTTGASSSTSGCAPACRRSSPRATWLGQLQFTHAAGQYGVARRD